MPRIVRLNAQSAERKGVIAERRSKKVSSRGKRLLSEGRRRLRGVARRAELRRLVALALRSGQRVWIVGGALRDLLLSRPVPEVDVVVSGDAGRLAQAMESAGIGSRVLLFDRAPRVFRVAGRREVDIAELWGGSIEADLARRDFTVNAIACEMPSESFRDPYGGVEDLARRRLRLISEKNIAEDPLRVVRAARLYATHRLVPDGAVARAALRASPGLERVAAERVRVELNKLLEADGVSGPLRWLRSVHALAAVLGFDASAVRTPRLGRALSRLDAPSVRQSPSASRRRLRLSLLAYGLRLDPAGTRRWLAGRRFSSEEAREVAALLELCARAQRTKTSRERWGWIRDSGPRRDEALRLLALLGHPALARRLRALRPRARIRITGADLIRWLKIAPGPAVGSLLREIEIEAAKGAVRSRRDARRWLDRHAEVASSARSR